MKNKFSWYFPISEDEFDSIWSTAVLTVDANVLLDLYRYHESTRNSLIKSLKDFEGRLWLSNQAAEEFIRNRSKVIVSSEKAFKQAKDEVEKIQSGFESTVTQLKGNRIIPAELADSLIEAINPAIVNALEKIEESKSNYPRYLKEDPILDELSKMFEGAVGDGFKKEDISEINKECEERKIKKIPPGYMDENKDGDRPYGDYYLWKQILIHSRNNEIPLIFVTSERKEDWWEKIAGKNIGPRPELLREAFEFTGQRILIYQTDRFLEYSSKKSGSLLDSSAVDEIRAIDSQRSNSEHAVEVIEQIITDNSEYTQEGVLSVYLHRPVKNLTGSGYFDPYMIDIPRVKAGLIESPDSLGKFKIRTGAGTTHDFNLHLIAGDGDSLLPVGKYTFKYIAVCTAPEKKVITVEVLAEIVGVSPARLLNQLRSAGLDFNDELQEVSESDRLKLLNYLKKCE
ncbi:PIN domain-containing protein [Marinobacterium stanieri]|uniref:PIN domain-containing protein n=1 Tax=Marinobacterium stanieri TaxID=49186 RepID=UPI000255A154|nr:PIN domain-containing protein [Marinobacterium stanieri]